MINSLFRHYSTSLSYSFSSIIYWFSLNIMTSSLHYITNRLQFYKNPLVILRHTTKKKAQASLGLGL